MVKWLEKYALAPALLFSGVIFLVGITWGLPSRKVDPYLFGGRHVWTGEQIVKMLPNRPLLSIGADVDPNAAGRRPVIVNDTDAKRAEILVRYRLYSYQPDEMITFRALSTIAQTRGDPRLYQYGGLWIYPVGALLKAASMVGLIELRPDLAFYLDRPEVFARFYIVARLYVVAWALVGTWAVFWLMKRWTGENSVALIAAIVYAQTPVVVNMAHEAKPHLPSAVLMLLAVVASVRFIETGARRWIVLAGALCGGAFAMVLTGVLSFILLPVACYLRLRHAAYENAASQPRPRLATLMKGIASGISRSGIDLALAIAIGLLVYVVTNPFVVIHCFGDRTILLSNLENSQAMYRTTPEPDTLLTAARLIADGVSPLMAGVGVLAIVFLKSHNNPIRRLMLLLSLPILIQFVLLATNKPAEYARFAIIPDITLALCAVGGIAGIIQSRTVRRIVLGGLCAACGVWTIGYSWHFVRDASPHPSRMVVAQRLTKTYARGARELAVYNDPAPYCLPPVNLFDWKIVLLDPGAAPLPTTDLLVKPTDRIPSHDVPMRGFIIEYWTRPRVLATPISWATKPFRVIVRKEFLLKQQS